jgi:hypothetical protein
MITESLIPMVIVPVTFLFVLLIILITKAPKAGAWVVGSLVLLAPLFLWRLAAAGVLARAEAIPLVVVPVTFLFVLMVILLAKAPKAGASLLVALVAMVVLGLFFIPVLSFRRTSYSPTGEDYPATQTGLTIIRQQSDSGAGEAVVQEFDRVFEGYVQEPPIAPESPALVPMPPRPSMPVVASPIWAEGIDSELEAEVYPSKLAAVRALGSRVDRSIRKLTADVNSPAKIVLFQEQNDRILIVELKNAVERSLPDATCVIEAEPRNIQRDETGITVRFADTDMQPAPWAKSAETKVESARIEINVSTPGGHMATGKRFVEKPWMEDFATFASTRPDQHFIVTRSIGTCTSDGEAHQQALDDARARLTEALGKRGRLPEPTITATDVLKGGFVVDQFAQSFEGSAGKIWRQAMLIDVSGPKLAQLSGQKTHESRQMRATWARMGFSVIGVTVLIGAIYFFLNMATMGYYEWSLRIAGVVLAIVAVISILMVVR